MFQQNIIKRIEMFIIILLCKICFSLEFSNQLLYWKNKVYQSLLSFMFLYILKQLKFFDQVLASFLIQNSIAS
jgi:hypothetical protein